MTGAALPLVTGIGIVSSLGPDAASFAAGLRAGRTGIAALPGGDGPAYGARIGELVLADALADRTGLPEPVRRSAARVAGRSPQPVQAALLAALEAWQCAGLAERPLPGDRIALVVGGHNLTGRHADQLAGRFRANPAYLPPRFALQMLDTDHIGTISQVLGITGAGFTIGGASASGSLAVIAGSRLVESGEADACLVIGALTAPSAMELQALANLGALAWEAASVPFDRSRSGFVPGEAAAGLVLESAASARVRRAAAPARLAGYAQRLDANSLADPSEDGEVAVMTAALRRAGCRPPEVGYVNAHGTGSPLGDDTEVRAIRRIWTGPDRPWVNSTKALAGHCLAAAGVVEAVATVIQLRDGFLHPNPGLKQPIEPGCRFVGERAEPVRVRLALSNGFGFGGFSSCLALAPAGAQS